MAHLITKLNQRPRKAHIYPSNEQVAHYILEMRTLWFVGNRKVRHARRNSMREKLK